MADRISELPIDVLHCILNGLCVREAAATTLLSTRWREVFPTVPGLCLNCSSSSSYSSNSKNKKKNKKLISMAALHQILASGRAIFKDCKIFFSMEYTGEEDEYDAAAYYESSLLELCRNGVKKLRFYLGHKYTNDYIDVAKMMLTNARGLKKLEINCRKFNAYQIDRAQDEFSKLSREAVVEFTTGEKHLCFYEETTHSMPQQERLLSN